MKLDYYFTRGVGRSADTDEAVRLALEATDPSIEINYIEVQDAEDAKDKRFFGTPTIRVDGVDVEYGEREPEEYQTGTRYYNTPQGWKPFPHARLIANTILELQARQKK